MGNNHRHKETWRDISGESSLANQKKLFIDFHAVATGKCIAFKAFITAFKDSFQSSWNEESVYGRNDPIGTFERTKRVISLSWETTSIDHFEAMDNMHAVEHLLAMLYPTYEEADNGNTISGSPLIKIKFANWIRDATKAGDGIRASNAGLLGYVGGFDWSPNFDEGFFDVIGSPGQSDKRPPTRSGFQHAAGAGGPAAYPKSISLSCNFTVLHTHPLGWVGSKWRSKAGERWPYGIDDQTSGKRHFTVCRKGEGGDNVPAAKSSNPAIKEAAKNTVIKGTFL